MKSGIYQIQQLSTGKRYVGSAVNIGRRWTEHRTQLKANVHNNKYLQNAWNKHGADDFLFSVLLHCSTDRLLVHEQGALDAIAPEFNIAKCANAPMFGRSHTRETREKLRQRHLGRVLSEETKRKISVAATGRVATPETRAKLSAALIGNSRATGNKLTDEVKAVVLAATRTPEARANHLKAMGKPEVRDAISRRMIGNKSKRFLGHKHSQETREKMSASRLAHLASKAFSQV